MSLAASFLADLEDIEETEISVPKSDDQHAMEVESFAHPDEFPSILSDPQFTAFITRVESLGSHAGGAQSQLSRSSEEFQLISKSNKYLPQIDAEIYSIYKFVADVYAKRFPELEQVVLMPFDYLRVVERLERSDNISDANLAEFLPTNLVVAITVTASTSSGSLRPLLPNELSPLMARISTAKSLAQKKESILHFLSLQMPLFAPNLNALLGSVVAAQLIAAAGGIENLASMPSQNIEAVGAHKQSLAGLSAASQQAKVSIVSQCDLVARSLPEARRRAMRLVVGKTSLAARVDQFGRSGNFIAAETGIRFRREIEEALRKVTEAPPARAIKPLPVPEEKPKARRGGKRARAWKEKYGLSDVQKKASRVQFGDKAQDEGMGMVAAELGGGRIRKGKGSSVGGGLTLAGGFELSLGHSDVQEKKSADLFSGRGGFFHNQ